MNESRNHSAPHPYLVHLLKVAELLLEERSASFSHDWECEEAAVHVANQLAPSDPIVLRLLAGHDPGLFEGDIDGRPGEDAPACRSLAELAYRAVHQELFRHGLRAARGFCDKRWRLEQGLA